MGALREWFAFVDFGNSAFRFFVSLMKFATRRADWHADATQKDTDDPKENSGLLEITDELTR